MQLGLYTVMLSVLVGEKLKHGRVLEIDKSIGAQSLVKTALFICVYHTKQSAVIYHFHQSIADYHDASGTLLN